MVQAFNQEYSTDLAINPDLRDRQTIQLFTTDLLRRSKVKQLGVGENVSQTRASIPTLLYVRVEKPLRDDDNEK